LSPLTCRPNAHFPKSTRKLNMANQTAPVQLSVVPTPQTQKEIENTLDAPRRISEAIENFKKQRADAEAELVRSLCKDLAAAPFNVESAIEKHTAWKARDDALAAKIKTAEELLPIIQRRIDELKTTQPEVLKAVLRRKLEQLEKEAAAEKDKAALLKDQIDSLKTLLQELEKSASTVAKSQKN
jgi:DNA repair exonuclease SbcCD ATPase subunit